MIFLCRILARIHSSRQWQKKKKEQNERKQKRKTYIFSDTHHLLLFHVTILHLYHGSSASRGESLESFSNRKERDKFATIEHTSLLYTSLSSFSSVFALAFYVNSYCPGIYYTLLSEFPSTTAFFPCHERKWHTRTGLCFTIFCIFVPF